jgi:hypothetical protein
MKFTISIILLIIATFVVSRCILYLLSLLWEDADYLPAGLITLYFITPSLNRLLEKIDD